ncbi:Hsp20/alpha crystallin family protein [Oerskovia turbata]|uniref:Hsp20/alpha crystallin family protein n=1 Tax=Oerskovia turbata TaxID=1713 RepID=A0A4Q1KTC7_9CELL|nr:Hsp20/alpha crystallin family protein [Oerskovia turbata]RXR25835.1 Hsp20/alpha crystallin family protein [Oerskovia turbata]RXR33401.1 Hsp20/alpha crystallin family protein [Oerskovia turbata]TGJ96142.1 Hsp20/alpha crystallin family protein [Actinotalea fermentans ATCC 43279 = JCM 9966 = DSM 3133]TGJ96144.1 Hsp20/alpha crystallin family protein [Actinotalea fermentans ATCC 43279 = JCM 9966 = DSM 3133]
MTTTLTTAPAFDRALRDLLTARPVAGVPAHADVFQDGDDLVARFDLPGIDPAQDVTVEVEGRKLVVRGERKDERAEEAEGRRVREVRYGAFHRVVTLPQPADASTISARYDAGVLTVTVSGVYAGTTPQRIEVTTSAS